MLKQKYGTEVMRVEWDKIKSGLTLFDFLRVAGAFA